MLLPERLFLLERRLIKSATIDLAHQQLLNKFLKVLI
jgi:hypothetical protein